MTDVAEQTAELKKQEEELKKANLKLQQEERRLEVLASDLAKREEAMIEKEKQANEKVAKAEADLQEKAEVFYNGVKIGYPLSSQLEGKSATCSCKEI
eukprot:scaffold235625_cov52-Prasinocladus_malaysianus.AAC.1